MFNNTKEEMHAFAEDNKDALVQSIHKRHGIVCDNAGEIVEWLYNDDALREEFGVK